ELTAWPLLADRGWCAGFLAAAFDVEGSYSGGCLRISTTEGSIIAAIGECLRRFGFRFRIEQQVRGLRRPIQVVDLLGGLVEQLRFFHTFDPATLHERDIAGQAVESEGRLRVKSIEPLGGAMRLFDITTGTGDFLANGVVSHNCYARPSHAYLDLSPGLDFETRIFYKANAAERLQQELSRPSYAVRPITLGANTDPYQPL